jgi:FO synthase
MRYLAADAARALTREPWHVLADRLPERDDVRVTYSRKVFIPLTRLCQDRCGYCTFAAHGGVADAKRAYLTPDEVLDIARRGVEAGCTEALFTLGDRPEARWPVAREALDAMGFESTVAYLASVAARVLEETGLLPHTNPGVLSVREMARLREVAVSQGLMLETVAEAASAPGGAHAGCVTKLPRTRLRQIELAGRLRVPFTTGLLLGLGETRADTVEALLRVRHSHERWGHVQELIVQPFRPKAGTGMASAEAFPEEELLWAVACAKLILGPVGVPIQSPPNLSADGATLRRLLRCGVDDWGGISPGDDL